MCVYIHIYTCILYMCIYVRLCVYMHIYTCILHMCIYVRMYVYMCVGMYVCTIITCCNLVLRAVLKHCMLQLMLLMWGPRALIKLLHFCDLPAFKAPLSVLIFIVLDAQDMHECMSIFALHPQWLEEDILPMNSSCWYRNVRRMIVLS